MAGVGRSTTSPAQIKVNERQIRALNLRKAGATFPEIAEAEGYASPSGAYEAVKAALKKTMSEPAEELRQLELTRLDDMLASIWDAVLAGDTDSIATALRISERRARLLGLDRPDPMVKVQVGSVSVGKDEFSKMSNAELREYIQREAEENGVGGAGTGEAGNCQA